MDLDNEDTVEIPQCHKRKMIIPAEREDSVESGPDFAFDCKKNTNDKDYLRTSMPINNSLGTGKQFQKKNYASRNANNN